MTLDEKVIGWLAHQDAEIYLVGGCVRDRLLGRPVYDLDITTSSSGLALARRLADHFAGDYFPLDRTRSTGRAILRESHDDVLVVDVARFRGASLADDVADRDFTVNALASSARNPAAVIDNHGGLSDLAAGLIHPVSDACIRNDPLRALRAVRQAAELGFRCTDEAERLIRRDGHLLHAVSAERIRDELSRLLLQPDASTHLFYSDRLGVLTTVIPELEPLRGLAQPKPHHLDALTHSLATLRALDELLSDLPLAQGPSGSGEGAVQRSGKASYLDSLAPFASRLLEHLAQQMSAERSRLVTVKLAALLHDTGKPWDRTVDEGGRIRFLGHEKEGTAITGRTLRRLRFSNAEVRLAETIVRHHMRPLLLADQESVSRRAVYRFFRDTGETGVDILLHALADHRATYAPEAVDDRWPRLVAVAARMLTDFWERPRQAVAPPPIIGGRDLLRELDLQPGPQIGELLEIVREAQVAGMVGSRDEALALLRIHLDRTLPEEATPANDRETT